ncbi:DNA-binding protein, partial [Salmonella enterica]|nr:DNA-binding protein [Salmonella enterica]
AKQNPSPDKYKYIDTDDSEKIWTAQGQTSKSTTAVIEAGKKLEYFAI